MDKCFNDINRFGVDSTPQPQPQIGSGDSKVLAIKKTVAVMLLELDRTVDEAMKVFKASNSKSDPKSLIELVKIMKSLLLLLQPS